ncbi:MAG: sulfur carrier protein ThiS [Helicobacteraceae bacterium]|nr:sulfur carrier protein ThiS [Helicobacteraceae bacterium]
MNLIINGTTMEFESNKNIDEILRELKVESKIFAITLNSELVKKEDYKNTIPKDNDRLEFLQFMGGG